MSKIMETKDKEQLSNLFDLVCKTTGIPAAEIIGKSRRREVCDARHVFFYVAIKKNITKKPGQAAEIIGRDRCTEIHGVAKIEDLMFQDKEVQQLVNKILKAYSPQTFESMTEAEKIEATENIILRIETIKEWLVNHPENPYRIKIQNDLRQLEKELQELK